MMRPAHSLLCFAGVAVLLLGACAGDESPLAPRAGGRDLVVARRGLGASVRIGERRLQRALDARERRLNEQAYGLVQNLDNTWLIEYVVSVYSGRRRENGFGFNIQVEARNY